MTGGKELKLHPFTLHLVSLLLQLLQPLTFHPNHPVVFSNPMAREYALLHEFI